MVSPFENANTDKTLTDRERKKLSLESLDDVVEQQGKDRSSF